MSGRDGRLSSGSRAGSAAVTATAAVVAVSLVLSSCHAGTSTPSPPAPSPVTSPAVAVTEDTTVLVLLPADETPGGHGNAPLLDVLDRRYAHRVSFQNTEVPSGNWEGSRAQTADVLPFGEHGGDESLADDAAAGRVRDLTGLYDELGLGAVWPSDLRDLLATDGRLYQLPLYANRTNLLWASRPVLRRAGLDPDATYSCVDDWIDALRKVAAAGEQPLALDTSQLQAALLENLLLADLGPAAYRGLWDGTTDWAGGGVSQALDQLRTIVGVVGKPGKSGRGPYSVLSDDAAFVVTSDRLAPEIAAVDSSVNGMNGVTVDVGHQVMPGTAGTFAFVADTYAWDARSTHDQGARAWFETVSSVEGQTAVVTQRSGVPVRTDVDPASFDQDTRAAIGEWADDQLVPSAMFGGPLAPRISAAFTRAASQVVRGRLTPRELQTRMTGVIR